MSLVLFNDGLDDLPVREQSEGFFGTDTVSKPTLLPPNFIRTGSNIWMDVDGLIRTRPGLRFNALCNTLPLVGPTTRIQGAAYFDTPALERILAVRDGKLYEIVTAENAAAVNHLAGPTPSTTADIKFAQLVDRMFYTDGTLTLRWAYYTAGWTFGTVATFSDTSAMPAWKLIVAHKFRLLAVDADGTKLYASAIGDAYLPANWVRTENIRIGSGEGDPIKAVLSSQSGNLIVLTERAAWQVDTSDASAANWIVRKITGLIGCVEGKTAVEIGQDVLYLSRYGVVSLGALTDNIGLNASTTLSSPMQGIINRINWSAIDTAWATTWRDLYILALPITTDTTPTIFLCYNTRTKAWATPWAATLATANLTGGVTAAFTGWTGAVVTRFGAKQETLITDNCGRLLRFDDNFEADESAVSSSVDIISHVRMRAHAFGAEESYKQPFWLEIDWFNSTAEGVQVNLVRDGLLAYPDKSLASCEIVASGLETNDLVSFPIKFPFYFQPNEVYRKSWTLRKFSRFREVSVQIVALRGVLKIRTVRIAAFVDTPALIR